MARSAGNTRLKSARLAAGYTSQQALADALGVGVRQVRRWESPHPPWPQPDVQQVLTRTLGQDLESLGFTPPDGVTVHRGHRTGLAATPLAASRAAIPTQVVAPLQPATVAADYAMVTRSHRRLTWSVAPATLHPPVLAHATLGCALLPETAGQTRTAVAAALAETFMLAGRMEFFDLREPQPAAQTLLRALQAAAEADEPLLGAAILAHTAFIPGWDGRRDEAVERMTAARTYARRGPASTELLAWLDAVEAECETRCGNFRTALHLIGHAEDILASDSEYSSPEWLDWFSPARLAAFKGNTQLTAGHLPQPAKRCSASSTHSTPARRSRRPSSWATWPRLKPRRTIPRCLPVRDSSPRPTGTYLVRDGHGPGAGSAAYFGAAPARAVRARVGRQAVRLVDDSQRAGSLTS